MLKALAIAAMLGVSSGAGAGELTLSDAVPGHPQTSVLDLMRQVIADLTIDADGQGHGTAMAPLRYLGDDVDADPPADIAISGAELVTLRVDGRPFKLLYSALGRSDAVAEVVLLALYDDRLQLLDAVDVGVYENNWFGEVFAIGAGNDGVRLDSEHFNSSQGYDAAQLVFARDGKLALIDAVYFFSVKGAGYEELQSLSVTAQPDGAGYWPITATIHATRAVEPADPADAESSTPPAAPPYDRLITQTYTWSASIGGYVADGDAFDRLNAENEAKY